MAWQFPAFPRKVSFLTNLVSPYQVPDPPSPCCPKGYLTQSGAWDIVTHRLSPVFQATDLSHSYQLSSTTPPFKDSCTRLGKSHRPPIMRCSKRDRYWIPLLVFVVIYTFQLREFVSEASQLLLQPYALESTDADDTQVYIER